MNRQPHPSSAARESTHPKSRQKSRPRTRLKICLVSYRTNPHSGGQGVYVTNLGRALSDLGHDVHVLSGPPPCDFDPRVTVHRLPCLDLYNPDDLFRVPTFRELLDPVNVIEWLGVSTMGFPEPFTFGLRAWRFMLSRIRDFDVLHDNQSLSYGVWALGRRLPAVATIHHPVTVDRRLAVAAQGPALKKMQQLRWHSFIRMQKQVAAAMPRILTVSETSAGDVGREFGIPRGRFSVVPNGTDTDQFFPLPGVRKDPCRIITTASAETPLKGLAHLLRAVAALRAKKAVRLTVVGTARKNGGIERLVRDLDLGAAVAFTGRIDNGEFRRQYARASVAVVPSLYEGFGLPAGEAMACRVPVVSTTGGALPEVVGDAGVLVPPGDPAALARAISGLLDDPDRAFALANAGFRRVHERFTWKEAAKNTVSVYREAIRDHR